VYDASARQPPAALLSTTQTVDVCAPSSDNETQSIDGVVSSLSQRDFLQDNNTEFSGRLETKYTSILGGGHG
jgi:hypothetical protein